MEHLYLLETLLTTQSEETKMAKKKEELDYETETSMDYETDPNILDIDTEDSVEPTCVDDGEYRLQIVGPMEDKDGDIVRKAASGNEYFMILLEIPSEPTSKDFSHFFSVPNKDMSPKRLNQVKWKLEEFKRAFGLDSINFSTMQGATGWGLIGTKIDEYGEKNIVKKFLSDPTDTGEPF